MSDPRFNFSINQTLYQRNNPDASRITPTRVLGFSGTIDISALGASQDVTIQLDGDTPETQTVSLAAVVDDTAATVAELVTAFTGATFTDFTFSADSATGRFLAAYSGAGSPTYVQMIDDGTDALVQAMDIGQGTGAKILIKDHMLSSGNTANRKDKEEIATEDGNGVETTVEFAAKLKGFDVSTSMQDDDPELKELLTGGSWDSTTNIYTYPSQNDEPPQFSAETFVNQYLEGVNKKADFTNVKRTVYYSGTGVQADTTNDAKAWTPANFDLSFLDYADPTQSDARVGPAFEQIMSVAEFQAFDWDSF